MKSKDVLALFGLAALWGASFLFIRIASPVIGPFLTIQGRVSIAGFVLLLIIWMTKQSAGFRARWKQYLIIGALNAAIPFTLIAFAALHLNASLSAILNSMTPLFTALVAWLWLKERLTPRKWIGIALGMIGVIVLVGWSRVPFTQEVFLSIGLCTLSTISYSFAGVYAKKAFVGVPALSVAMGQQMGAAALLFPLTIMFLPAAAAPVPSLVIYSVLGLALLCTAIAYLLYFYLIANVGPTKTLSVTFLIPLFGMLWGVIFLQEPITSGMIAGLAIILCSILFISDIPLHLERSERQKVAGH
ncbi:DMT family transporter [Brevibacillus sp. SYSU BS000544]|uniref:DMT family transporter n=1 Tax=Brevibacillus sp. SYSU BS000544 TaxID=3416443 RepID=UPI003CE4C722